MLILSFLLQSFFPSISSQWDYLSWLLYLTPTWSCLVQNIDPDGMYDLSDSNITENWIKTSDRPKYSKWKSPSKKLDHHNKVLYKKFEDIFNFQHSHGGITGVKCRENKQLSYWVKNQSKFYWNFLQDENTTMTPEHNPALENIGFFWTI